MNLRTRLSVEDRSQEWKRLAHAAAYQPGKLAKLCDLSLRQLERYFQQDYGCSPGGWLRLERMRAARVLLRNAESIKQVAYALGFTQTAHFCVEFKRWHGITPVQFLVSRKTKPEELVRPE